MSDWEGYSRSLADRLDYTNTYYHTEPRLDITRVPQDVGSKYDFLIASDVFEHIPLFALVDAFENARKLLRSDGFLLLTVPFAAHEATREHYPRLHDFQIRNVDGKATLFNRTRDGIDEVFDDLVFHGGEGSTLEMRKFGARDLVQRLKAAGFASIRFCTDYVPEFGIRWPNDSDLPIVARPLPFGRMMSLARRGVRRLRTRLTRS